MRIAVFGAGAIGSYYGAGFAKGGAEVHLISRGAHLDAMRSRGLTIVTSSGTETLRLPASDDPASIGPVDAVLLTVKSYDTAAAVGAFAPLLRRTPLSPGAGSEPATWSPGTGATVVVSLQNGVANEDTIASAVGAGQVIGGSAYIFAAIREPGVVVAGDPRIVLGEWGDAPPSGRLDALITAARLGGIPAEAAPDIRVAKWEKFTLLAALSAMTAGTRLPLGELRRSEAAMGMLRSLMTETWSVGRASGVDLPTDVVDRQFARVAGQAADATSSLYFDLVTGHRLEVESLQGHVVRHARSLGVATPFMDAAYAMLQPWSLRHELAPSDRPPLPSPT